jgi:hypothetical protein
VAVRSPGCLLQKQPGVRSVNNFNGRAGMLRAAAESFFRQYPAWSAAPVRKDFNVLMRLCEHFAARRNDIAHGKRDVVPGRSHYLVPAFYNTKSTSPANRWPSATPQWKSVITQIISWT